MLSTSDPQFRRFLAQARRVGRRFGGRYGLDPDDCESVAIYASLRAAARFDPARGFQFNTYAWAPVNRQLQAYADQERRHACYSLEAPHPEDPELEWKDMLVDPHDPIEARLQQYQLDVSLRALSADDARVLRQRYFEHQHLKDIAVTHGIGESAAGVRVFRATQRLLKQAGVPEAITTVFPARGKTRPKRAPAAPQPVPAR